MSKIKVGINGFGRIGRITFRAILRRDDVEVLAINDLLDVNHLAYLLKYDSVHGKLDDEINVIGNDLVVNGNKIRVTAEKNPLDINWGDLEIDVVAECTGIFTTMDKAALHIDAGAKKVAVSAPSKDIPMFVMGVNCESITSDHKIVSNVTAKETNDTNEIKNLLIKQIENPVRWRESVINMINSNIDKFIEIGPGKVLSGLIKRIDRNKQLIQVNDIEDIKNLN